MSVASVATASGSFELVYNEIANTVKQASQFLDRFQSNRESTEDLQNCIDCLNQLRGIFIVVEVQGGTLLCQEAVSLANEVPIGATDDKNNLLTTLNSGLFILNRYVEYYRKWQEDHPELLLPMINELRVAQKAKPFPDSHFFDITLNKNVDYKALLGLKPFSGDTDFEIIARRMRHMYQVALLGLLNEEHIDVSLKLLVRCAVGFSRLCFGTPLADLWSLLAIAGEAMLDRKMEISKSRKRLFMRIEKYTKELVYVGKVVTAKSAPDSITKELLYMLALSGSTNAEVSSVLHQSGAEPCEFTEAKLLVHRERLFGPGEDVFKSVAEALQEEVGYLKDKLDIIERGIDPDVTDFTMIASGLSKLASTLVMLSQNELAALANKHKNVLEQWSSEGFVPTENQLLDIADGVLQIEQSVKRITNNTMHDDEETIESNDKTYLREARIVVIAESQSGLALTKRAITAYMEANCDRMHLANVVSTLESISGAMFVLQEADLAGIVDLCCRCIRESLINNESKPDSSLLDVIADVLTSLEYYLDTMSGVGKPNKELLTLASESLKTVGYGAE